MYRTKGWLHRLELLSSHSAHRIETKSCDGQLFTGIYTYTPNVVSAVQVESTIWLSFWDADACQCIRIFRGSDHHLVVTLCTWRIFRRVFSLANKHIIHVRAIMCSDYGSHAYHSLRNADEQKHHTIFCACTFLAGTNELVDSIRYACPSKVALRANSPPPPRFMLVCVLRLKLVTHMDANGLRFVWIMYVNCAWIMSTWTQASTGETAAAMTLMMIR